MQAKKILVIGSNSFTGSHFVSECINKGHKVLGISRSTEPDPMFLPYKWLNNSATKNQFKFKKVDINHDLGMLDTLLGEFMPEVVVNFAAQGMVAQSWENPSDWYQTNVVGQVQLHERLRKEQYLEKYVHITTPEVYGSTGEGWTKENFNFNPSTPYAVSRAACDLHLKTFFETYQFPVVYTRAANVYGPGQQLYRIIPRAILTALTGSKMDLHGGGNSIRSFIHVSDVVRATLKLALEAQPGTSWHISTNRCISIKSLVKTIFKLAGANYSDNINIAPDRKGKDQQYLLDSSALREIHGWEDIVELESGLKETISWVKEHLDEMKILDWNYRHKQ